VFSQARVGAVITEMGLVYREYQQEFGKQHAGNDNALRLYDKALETPQKDQTEQRQKPTKIVWRQHVHHSLSHSRSNQTENKHLPFSMHNSSKPLLSGSEMTTLHNSSLQTMPDLDQKHG